MRDLIRNYKLLIKGKTQPDSESEFLRSSTSSSGCNMDVGEPRMFKQEQCSSTDSEDEVPLKKSPKRRKSLLREHVSSRNYGSSLNMDEQHGKLYNNLQFSSLNEVITETSKLLPSIKIMDSSATDKSQSSSKQSNNSLVTIFAVWNTTVGTSLLAMAWGMDKTGLLPGVIINLFVVAVCLYTAYVLLKINEKHGIPGEGAEVPELCRLLIGRWAEIVSKIFSLIVLIGGDIVYWILMSNFLYNFVLFLYGYLVNGPQTNSETENTVLCPKHYDFTNKTNSLEQASSSTFDQIWNLYSTVPVFLAFMLFPILNLKSPTFFTKFNSLGTLSVGYLIVFVAVKSFKWGINVDDWNSELYIKPTFCVLSGMLGMSYFIHNIIISIMKQNKNQEKNGRDLTIAFGLVTFTYLFLGISFYVTFPSDKSCIEDNFLNNFSKTDLMALIARILLFFQLFTVFPFVTYMLRTDVLSCLNMFYGKKRNIEFSYFKTIVINLNIVLICIIFACFLPKIGTLIRFTGALSGLIYIFVMPSLLKMASLKQEGSLKVSSVIVHVFIMVLGVLNLVSQFFISE